jgi:hypothetical protein
MILKFYIYTEYDQKNICEFFIFFMNFVSSFTWLLHRNSVCTWYIQHSSVRSYPSRCDSTIDVCIELPSKSPSPTPYDSTVAVWIELPPSRYLRSCTSLTLESSLELSLEGKQKNTRDRLFIKRSNLHNFLCILCLDYIYYKSDLKDSIAL